MTLLYTLLTLWLGVQGAVFVHVDDAAAPVHPQKKPVFSVSGWALDIGAPDATGVDHVRVVAGTSCDGTVLATAPLKVSRPDVVAMLGLDAGFLQSGYRVTLRDVPVGEFTYQVCAYQTATGNYVPSGAPVTATVLPYSGHVTRSTQVAAVWLAACVVALVTLMTLERRHGRGYPRWRWAVGVAFGALPMLFIGQLVYYYGMNAPIRDEWEISTVLYANFALRNADWGAFWALQNEHRYVVPRLISLTLAEFTRYNLRALTVVNLAMAAALVAPLVALYHGAKKRKFGAYGLILPLALLLHFPRYWSRWADPLSLSLFSALLFSLLSIVLVFTIQSPRRAFWLAALSALIASLSFFTGNIAWVVGGLAVLWRYRRSWYAPLWGGLAALVGITYLMSYLTADSGTTTATPSLVPMLHYVAVLIGSPLVAPGSLNPAYPHATALGVGAALLVGVTSWQVSRKTSFGAVVPWLLIALWVVINALFAAYARVGTYSPASAAGTLRYAMYGAVFWAVAVVLTIRTFALSEHRIVKGLCVVVLVGIGVQYTLTNMDAMRKLDRRYPQEELAHGLDCLNEYQTVTDGCYMLLNPYPFDEAMVLDAAPMLIQRRASFIWQDEFLLLPDDAVSGAFATDANTLQVVEPATWRVFVTAQQPVKLVVDGAVSINGQPPAPVTDLSPYAGDFITITLPEGTYTAPRLEYLPR
jgi:hypothetical protein